MAVLVKALLALLALLLQHALAANPGASAITAQLREPTDTYVTAYINVTYRDPRTGEVRSERSETAKYGDGRIGAARGVLVHAVSLSAPGGCATPLVRHGHRANGTAGPTGLTGLPTEPWVALVPRGHCTFDMKVFTASYSGAAAIIIFDDKEADTLDMMDISPEHNITAVLTYHWKGAALAKLADTIPSVFVEITVANRCTRSLNSINRTSVLFVSVSFIVLMIISLAWLVFYYVQRFRYIHAKDRLSRRLCSAAKRALSKIPTRRLKIDDPELVGDGDCCAICIERYRVADVIRALPCRHEFHKSCIDPWLLDHRTCPMCKMDILKHYGFVFTGSQESILHLDIEEVAAFGLVDSPHSPRGRIQHLREQHLHQPQPTPMHQPQSPQSEEDIQITICQADCPPRCPCPDEGSLGSSPSAERCYDYGAGCSRADPAKGAKGGKGGKGGKRGKGRHQGQGPPKEPDQDDVPTAPPARPSSPGALSTTSVASMASVASSSSGSASSVTDSILPQVKRALIVAADLSSSQ